MTKGDYLVHLSTLYTKAEMKLIICVLWCIWTEKNTVIHGGKTTLAIQLVGFSLTYLKNLRSAKHKFNPSTTITHDITLQSTSHLSWQPPVLKIIS
uniref:Uncharacterized protein n=1 Tax=Cannabis sativa TaxID=3483 RepID=A0A803RBW2_CANSA